MPEPIQTDRPKPAVMLGEPPAFELEAVGLFIRVGPSTLVRYDQIVGLRGLDYMVVQPVPAPEAIEADGDEGEDDEPEAVDAEQVGELRRGTHLFFAGLLPMQVQDSYGRPAEALLLPYPEGDVLALIERLRRSERS